MTESILVEKMAQSYWLSVRALKLQNCCLANEDLTLDQLNRELPIYIRYQTTHDRAFQRALADLLKLRAERRRTEIGFESQRRQDAIFALRQSTEKRKQETHQFAVLLAEAKVDHQTILNANLEFEPKVATAGQTGSPDALNAA